MMTRTKTVLLYTAILVVALLSAGCVGGLGGDDSTNDSPDATNGDAADTGAEDLRIGAAETMEDVETAAFTMEMSMDTSEGVSRDVR